MPADGPGSVSVDILVIASNVQQVCPSIGRQFSYHPLERVNTYSFNKVHC